jgi:hypothetical protein
VELVAFFVAAPMSPCYGGKWRGSWPARSKPGSAAMIIDSSSDYLIEAGISPGVIALVPGPIARENVLLPYSATKDTIKILFAEPADIDLLLKLNYILRRSVHPALARRVAILAAIDHYYGCSAHELRHGFRLKPSLHLGRL